MTLRERIKRELYERNWDHSGWTYENEEVQWKVSEDADRLIALFREAMLSDEVINRILTVAAERERPWIKNYEGAVVFHRELVESYRVGVDSAIDAVTGESK